MLFDRKVYRGGEGEWIYENVVNNPSFATPYAFTLIQKRELAERVIALFEPYLVAIQLKL